jgi:hypothetical protein
VRFCGEPLAVVTAPRRTAAEQIRAELRPLPLFLDARQAVAPDAPPR